MEGAIDRRAARTRRTLHDALIRLILRKGYDALTVQEIIDDADVGRATFYAHYRGKDDLLRGGFERLRNQLKTA
jgi:AcrR family transcriptional regulator